MAQYNSTFTLSAGVPLTVLDGSTAIGTAKSQQFCTQNTDSQNVNVEVNGTFSVGTVDLERSTDGGTTWVAVPGQTAIDIVANKTWTFFVPVGLPHRLNLKTISGTSVTALAYVPQ